MGINQFFHDDKDDLLQGILDTTIEALWIVDQEGRIQMVNQAYCDLIGYHENELIGLAINDIDSHETKAQTQTRMQVIQNKGYARFSTKHRTKDGRDLDIEMSVTYLPKHNVFICFGRDITERLKTRKKIEKLLDEKEIILREVHHRIKNNLNTVISLLGLQASMVEDPVASQALSSAQQRIQSMSGLYDQLYQGENYDVIQVKRYLTKLIHNMLEVFPEVIWTNLELDISDISLDTSRTGAMGIMINEMVTNSCKYALHSRDSGKIHLRFYQDGEDYHLIYYDDGDAKDVSQEISQGFGSTLIQAMIAQLEGQNTPIPEHPWGYHVIFPATPSNS